jgi:hypothetical protein
MQLFSHAQQRLVNCDIAFKTEPENNLPLITDALPSQLARNLPRGLATVLPLYS